MRIGGTTIQYYFACKREVWLYLHQIDPPQDDENLTIGRIIHEKAFQGKGRKEIQIGGSKLDVVQQGQKLTILEVKKSSKFLEPTVRQLQYYLLLLKKQGIDADGVISVPKEKLRLPIFLEEKDILALEEALENIPKIASLESIPPYVHKPYCKGCAYKDFCEV